MILTLSLIGVKKENEKEDPVNLEEIIGLWKADGVNFESYSVVFETGLVAKIWWGFSTEQKRDEVFILVEGYIKKWELENDNDTEIKIEF